MTGAQVAEMVRLRVDEGLTRDRIAERLGVPLSRVKRRWSAVPIEHRRRPMLVLDEEQIQEMIRLRVEMRLSQRKIAEEMGLGLYLIQRVWYRIPDECRRYLPEARKRGGRTRRKKKRLGTDEQCRCGWIFDDDNPRGEGGMCALCELQEAGRVVLYYAGVLRTRIAG